MKRFKPTECDPEYYRLIVNSDKKRIVQWRRDDKMIQRRVRRLLKYCKRAVTDVNARLSAMGDVRPDEPWVAKKGAQLCAEFDRAFGAGAAQAVFAGVSPFGTAEKTGNCLFVDALHELLPHVHKSLMLEAQLAYDGLCARIYQLKDEVTRNG